MLRNCILALLEQPEATLADIPRLFADQTYRRTVAQNVSNEQVRNFWLQEYERYGERLRAEAISPVQNKVGAFLSDPILQRILLKPKSSFDLRDVMDHRKILLVNLSKGRIGGDASALLGALLVSRIGLAAMSRADVRESERPDFHLFLDEFQTYATQSLASMLSELRKYHLCLVLGQQFLSQTDQPVRDAILGNVGTIIAFRVGALDAELLELEFKPEFLARDLVALPNYSIYLKLMVDGIVSRPFSAETTAAGCERS
ncbi:MAG: type IV secretory system conjugative DNA transfer family protein [Candidatus Sumerlaeaceae bacterium]